LTEPYLERKKQRDDLEELKNKSIFGLMGGVILMVAGALKWLSTERPWDIFYVCVFALGAVFFILGFAVPDLLKYPYKAFVFWGNLVGKAVFAVVLTVLYFLFIFPVGLAVRKKRAAQGYFVWEQDAPEPRSMFRETAETESRGKSKAGRASYFSITYKLFSAFAANGKYILIPAVIALVIIGLILFFVSSNVMTAFIYTIF